MSQKLRKRVKGKGGVILKPSLLIIFFFFSSFLFSQEILWINRLDMGESEYGGSLVFDTDRNILLAGGVDYLSNPINYCDILLIKYNSDGETIWTRYYDFKPVDFPYFISLDREGNVLLAGSCGEGDLEKGFLMKLSQEGNLLWRREFQIPFRLIQFVSPIVDNHNNIFVSGFSYTFAGGGQYEGFLAKYNPEGNLQWYKIYNFTMFLGEIITKDGISFYIAGQDIDRQMLLMKVDTLGDTIWTRRYSFGGNNCLGWGLAIDSSDNIIIGGYIYRIPDYDIGIIKYTADGRVMWRRVFDFSPADIGSGVAVDRQENIYLVGSSGIIDSSDYRLLKLNSDGQLIWTITYDNNFDDCAVSLIIDEEDNIIISGASSNGINYDIVTIKYRGETSIKEERFKNLVFSKSLLFKNEKIYSPNGALLKHSFRKLSKGVYFINKNKKWHKLVKIR